MYHFINIISKDKILIKNLKYFSKHFNFKCFNYENIQELRSISCMETIILDNPSLTDIKILRIKYDCMIICIYKKYNQKVILNSYELGIDDYFTNPFSYVELLYKIKSFKRNLISVTNNLEYKTLKVIYHKKKAYIKSIELNLTAKEFMLLYILLKNINQYISREELIKLVFETNQSTRSIDTNICTLRSKIKPYNSNIKNKRNIGYIFDTQNI